MVSIEKREVGQERSGAPYYSVNSGSFISFVRLVRSFISFVRLFVSFGRSLVRSIVRLVQPSRLFSYLGIVRPSSSFVEFYRSSVVYGTPFSSGQ